VVNRSELQQLAEVRIRDAEALLAANQWSGAYYLAGYAVECALKACIAKLTAEHDFPDKEVVVKSYTHSIETLIDIAQLKLQRNSDAVSNSSLGTNWFISQRLERKISLPTMV
jgi:HEPN domain-containing protein